MVDIEPEHNAPPVIAVVCRRLAAAVGASNNAQGVLSSYIKAIEGVGGAVILVALQQLEKARIVLGRCDGLLLAGGEDVICARLDNLHKETSVDEKRDEVERALTRQAIRSGLPILGICRGMHIINVECGGTLIEIDGAKPLVVRHVNDWQAGENDMHDVNLTSNSSLVGAARGRMTVEVNSNHRYCIDQVSEEFVIAARASDGVIEAIERREGSYCVGIQWHLECLVDQQNDFAMAILSGFVNACRRGRRA